jgi:hypothetical protein
LSSAVDNGKDIEHVISAAIRDDVGSGRNHEFSGARDPARAASFRMLGQQDFHLLT